MTNFGRAVCAIAFALLFSFGVSLQVTIDSDVAHSGKYWKQPMKNNHDMSYTASVVVGSQKLDVILDTGSFDVVIFSSRCTSCGRGRFYDRSGSSTYAEGDLLTEATYGSGAEISQSATEVIQMGPLHIESQQFWEVVYAEIPILSSNNFQAIFGVGPPGEAKVEARDISYTYDSIIDLFRAAGFPVPEGFTVQRYKEEVPKKKTLLENFRTHRFSMCLERPSGAPGHFIWNDDDPQKSPGVFEEIEVAGRITWGVKLSNAGFRSKSDGERVSLGCDDCSAIVDSGTSLLMVPTDVYNSVVQELAGIGADCESMHLLPDLVFRLGETEFSLPPSAYIGIVEEETRNLMTPLRALFPYLSKFVKPTIERQCELLLGTIDAATQLGPLWILGMPFFRQYYTTFQLGQNMRTGSRRLFVARATDDCEPSTGTNLRFEHEHVAPLRVSVPHLQVSPFARQAHGRNLTI
eukprot:TRINITY_DN11311_c0_g1_i2.p1 TRINITY_DN11311_c0_g1~~TRINITY_DN11311_c0_g1_i2.p1  ORF type:complete len:482 (-),score=68.38 TRINITY_DN11311_c0_g1_i2:110-1501(-)